MGQRPALSRKLQSPWLDRRGRWSLLKTITLTLMFVPGLWMVTLIGVNGLDPMPYSFLIYASGIWSLWMLLLSLTITPARKIFGLNNLISVRRMIGVTGLIYALAHVVVYLGLDNYDLRRVVVEISAEPTLWVAAAATIGLLALGATSFDAAIRAVGSRAWNQLHNFVYPSVGLGILHFNMSPGSVGGTPFVMTGLFFWLMAWRFLDRAHLGTKPAALIVLALGTTIFTLGFEAGWLALYQAIPIARTIRFTFTLASGLAEAWQVMIAALTAAALAALFGVRTRTRLRFRTVEPIASSVGSVSVT